MSLQPARRTAVFVLLAALLLVPVAASAAPRSASPSFLPRLWSLLAILWPDEGCGIDPDGRCKGTAPALPATVDAGCGIDPSGLCKNAAPALPASADEGCGIDPSGRCTSGH